MSYDQPITESNTAVINQRQLNYSIGILLRTVFHKIAKNFGCVQSTLHICTPSIYARQVLFPSSGVSKYMHTLYILHCTVLFTSRYMKFTLSCDFVQQMIILITQDI